MSLSNNLVSQFVKVTNDKPEKQTETTVYGTTVEYNGGLYVKIDGSDRLTPISNSTTADVKQDERVTVMIKNHTATVTGNTTSPSARQKDMAEAQNTITSIGILVAEKATIAQLTAEQARIADLEAEDVLINNTLTAYSGFFEELNANIVVINESLTAKQATIEELQATKIDASVVISEYATIAELNSTNATIHNLEATYGDFSVLTTTRLEAAEAHITSMDTKYANIDFANVKKADIDELYVKSGLIENVTISEGDVTKHLRGVVISGDLIEANSLKADRLLVLGEDGLYYQMNVGSLGETYVQTLTPEEQDKLQNGLHGSTIIAKTVTAEKVAVNDLSAFGATIGGFNIREHSMYSGTKESAGNTTRGVYLDDEGQIAFGDETNYVKYYFDPDTETYKVAIAADTIQFALGRNVVDAFNSIDVQLESASSDLAGLGDDLESTNAAVEELGTAMEELSDLGNYVHIVNYEGEPCIDLGQQASDFKVQITNTRIMFRQGSSIPTYISNQMLITEKIEVQNELRQKHPNPEVKGTFSWAVRTNGNYGLIWKEEV